MKRIGFVMKVREGKMEEYKEHHKRVWPELLEAHRRTGWHNYSLFMREDGLVFGYFETPESHQAAVVSSQESGVGADLGICPKGEHSGSPLLFEKIPAVDAIEREEINAKWDEFMEPYLEAVNAATGEIMIELERVFHLD